MTWTVMSVNTQHGGRLNDQFEPEDRWAGLVELIRAEDPDVVLMQETGSWHDNRWTQHARAERDLGMRVHLTRSPAGGGAAVAHRRDVPWLAKEDHHAVHMHAMTHLQLDIGAAFPLVVISLHLDPFSAQLAAQQMQLAIARVYRYGGLGIIGGDINHVPLGDPEPDWSAVHPYNRTSRTVGDPPRGNTMVAELAQRGGLTEVGGYLADLRGDPSLRRPTGHAGLCRVDWFLTTPALRPAVVDYRVVATAPHTDHDAIAMDIDLDKIDHTLTRKAS